MKARMLILPSLTLAVFALGCESHPGSVAGIDGEVPLFKPGGSNQVPAFDITVTTDGETNPDGTKPINCVGSSAGQGYSVRCDPPVPTGCGSIDIYLIEVYEKKGSLVEVQLRGREGSRTEYTTRRFAFSPVEAFTGPELVTVGMTNERLVTRRGNKAVVPECLISLGTMDYQLSQ